MNVFSYVLEGIINVNVSKVRDYFKNVQMHRILVKTTSSGHFRLCLEGFPRKYKEKIRLKWIWRSSVSVWNRLQSVYFMALFQSNKKKQQRKSITFWTSKLIERFESSPIKSIVRFKGDTKEVTIRFNCFGLLESAVARYLPINGLIIWKLNVITGCLGSATKQERFKILLMS